MAGIFAFHCKCCGELHEGSPSFGFSSPDHYASLSEEQKQRMGELSSDFCSITHDEGTNYFVRAVLEVPIHGVKDPFLWSVWVSTSERSFNHYLETYDSPVEGDGFFGWLCNSINLYPSDSPRPADVYVQSDGTRPKVVLHSSRNEADQLVIDQQHGITVERAQQLAEQAMHG